MNVTYLQIIYYTVGILIGSITLGTWLLSRYIRYRKKKIYTPKQKKRYYSKVLKDKHAPQFMKTKAKDYLRNYEKKQ